MNVWRSAAGIIEVELTSAAPEEAITAINALGIDILSLLRCSDLCCRFQISRRDFRAVKDLADKRGEVLRIVQTKGFYWQAKAFFLRPVLAAGLCLLGILILFLPSRVLFVNVKGNQSVPANRILEAAEVSGVCFGTSRREVRSEKVKNAILAEIPQLQWVGVNTSGCVATISVRERTVPDTDEEKNLVSSIVAAKDGCLISATVTQGNPLFQIGQAVKEGQILVSGYTDCGICIQATRSKAEIYAQTNHRFHAVTPANYAEIQHSGRVRRKISVRIRKKRINLWKDSGISPTTCGRMYKEYYLSLPGGFSLPLAFCVESFPVYEMQEAFHTENQAEEKLNQFAKRYLPTQMLAGEILEENHVVTERLGAYHLHGVYTCVEMIGREQWEQIGEQNGKDS